MLSKLPGFSQEADPQGVGRVVGISLFTIVYEFAQVFPGNSQVAGRSQETHRKLTKTLSFFPENSQNLCYKSVTKLSLLGL
jgi:hypothetical protein